MIKCCGGEKQSVSKGDKSDGWVGGTEGLSHQLTFGRRRDGSEGGAVWTWVKTTSGRGTVKTEDGTRLGRRVWLEQNEGCQRSS